LTVLCPQEDEIESVFDISLSQDDANDLLETVEFAGPVRVSGRVLRDGHAFWLVLQANARIALECRRCLEAFEMEVEGQVEQRYTASQDEDVTRDEETLFCDGERLDATKPLREAVALSIPSFPLCSETCGGICPLCGRKVENPPCRCHEEEDDFGNRLGDNWT